MLKNLHILFFLTFLFSCEKDSITPKPTTETNSTSVEKQTKEDSLQAINNKVISVLKSGNYNELADFIHPEKGIRFSMYAYINPEKDKIFTRDDFEKYIDSNVRFTFGEKDGTGDPLVVSLKDYLKNWVWKRDFSVGNYSANEFQGTGNSLNNLQEKYTVAQFTENYIEGSEQYGGMDWNSLRLVFEKYNGKYFLVAIVNDEWTI